MVPIFVEDDPFSLEIGGFCGAPLSPFKGFPFPFFPPLRRATLSLYPGRAVFFLPLFLLRLITPRLSGKLSFPPSEVHAGNPLFFFFFPRFATNCRCGLPAVRCISFSPLLFFPLFFGATRFEWRLSPLTSTRPSYPLSQSVVLTNPECFPNGGGRFSFSLFFSPHLPYHTVEYLADTFFSSI